MRNTNNGSIAASELTTTRAAWSGTMRRANNGTSTFLYRHSVRAFDPDNRVATTIDGLGGTSANWYNVIAIDPNDPSGPTGPAFFNYDPDSNLLQATDPLNRRKGSACEFCRFRLLAMPQVHLSIPSTCKIHKLTPSP